MEQVIRISPDGRQVRFLSSGDDPLVDRLGEIESLVRASYVRFDIPTKKWKIFQRKVVDGAIVEEEDLRFSSSRRGSMLAYEQGFAASKLECEPEEIACLIDVHLAQESNSG